MNLLVRYGLFIVTLASVSILQAQSVIKKEADINMQSQAEGGSSAVSIKWFTFEEAIELNKGYPKKKVLIDVYTNWCGWCKKMDEVTFTHPEIASYINEHYWAVKLNAEGYDTIIYNGVTYTNSKPAPSRGNHQLAVLLLSGQMNYPSYVFLNEDNQMLTVVKGFIIPANFEPVIHYFGDNAHFNMLWETYSKSFVGKIPKEGE